MNVKVSAMYRQGNNRFIYHKCELFWTNSCPSIGRINKATDLIEFRHFHNHNTVSYNTKKMILSNAIK